jgi:hypothetical protein
MAQDPDTLCTRLERLEKLALQAAPEDRARLEETIHLLSEMVQALIRARETRQRTEQLNQEAKALSKRIQRDDKSR